MSHITNNLYGRFYKIIALRKKKGDYNFRKKGPLSYISNNVSSMASCQSSGSYLFNLMSVFILQKYNM